MLNQKDGYLNLREKPGTQAKIVSKLQEGDILWLRRPKLTHCFDMTCNPSWTHVAGVQRLDEAKMADVGLYTKGWVSTKHIQEVQCKKQEDQPPKPQATAPNPTLPPTWSAGVAPPPPPTMEDAPDWLKEKTYRKHR